MENQKKSKIDSLCSYLSKKWGLKLFFSLSIIAFQVALRFFGIWSYQEYSGSPDYPMQPISVTIDSDSIFTVISLVIAVLSILLIWSNLSTTSYWASILSMISSFVSIGVDAYSKYNAIQSRITKSIIANEEFHWSIDMNVTSTLIVFAIMCIVIIGGLFCIIFITRNNKEEK